MCAQFETVDVSPQRVAEAMEAIVQMTGPAWEQRVMPFAPAPVVVGSPKGRAVESMTFSLIPSWSKDRKPKFATHNARLHSTDEKTGKDVPIYQKPTWREPFVKRHCLVPIKEFIEPSYRGELAGNMLRFFQRDTRPLAAAGIWDSWTSKETGEVIYSFSIITIDPAQFIQDNGHDRMPLFLDENSYDEWLTSENQKPAELVSFLEKHQAPVTWDVAVDRPMKAGWEKRIPKG